MDLNDIKLPASVVANLYTHSLVDTGETAPVQHKPEPVTATTVQPPADTTAKTWKWLGENNRNILVAVQYDDVVHLPDAQLQFLANMLSACKLSLADVAIVNVKAQPQGQYKEIITQFKSKVALLFDIEPSAFGMPMNFPYFQIQPFDSCSFLYSPSLEELEADKLQKSKLWVALKRLFNL
jgi:hypothetical protein